MIRIVSEDNPKSRPGITKSVSSRVSGLAADTFCYNILTPLTHIPCVPVLAWTQLNTKIGCMGIVLFCTSRHNWSFLDSKESTMAALEELVETGWLRAVPTLKQDGRGGPLSGLLTVHYR